MSKIDLTNTTFIIPIRISHIDRLNNLEFLVNYLTENFNTNIMVYEADTQIKVTKNIINKVNYTFECTKDNIFHRTKYLNNMLKNVTTKYVVNQDCDVFIPIKSYVKAIELLETEVDVVYPYNGQFVDFNRNELKEVSKTFDPKDFKVTSDSYGGMIFFNTEVYKNGGGEDEKFYGWGFEDRERIFRFRKLGYKITRMPNKLYHIRHDIGKNNGPNQPYLKENETRYHALVNDRTNITERVKLLKENLKK